MLRSAEIPRHGRLLILDTGPIRELVLFHAVQEFRFERLRSDLRFIKDQNAYKKCGRFIASFPRKTTGPSVAAELNCWIRDTEQKGQVRLWNRVYEEFRNMDLGEEVIRLVEMRVALVARFGPVDVNLMEIARRHYNDSPLILTIDSGLHRECLAAGLRVAHLSEVIPVPFPSPD